MSLRDEIHKLVNNQRARLDDAVKAESIEAAEGLARSRRLVEELRPALDELAGASDEPSIGVMYRENFAGTNDVTVIIRVGEVFMREEGSSSDVGFGDGYWWSFWPCFAEDGRVSWSFCDGSSKHEWFDSTSDLFERLISRVAEEIAIRQHDELKDRKSKA